MRFARIPVLLLAVVIAVAVMVLSLGVLGTASPVLAQEQGLAGAMNMVPSAQQAPPDFDFVFVVVFTDPAAVEIQDLSDQRVGEGAHTGAARCTGDTCSWKTQLIVDSVEIEYQFKALQVLDPKERQAVVSGKGTISSDGKKGFYLRQPSRTTGMARCRPLMSLRG